MKLCVKCHHFAEKTYGEEPCHACLESARKLGGNYAPGSWDRPFWEPRTSGEKDEMKIVILSVGQGSCPICNEITDFYQDYYRDDDGIKLPYGFECGNCGSWFTDKEFENIRVVTKPRGEE